MKHLKIFGTLAEMLAFLATNPTFGVVAMNNETGSFAAISSSDEPTYGIKVSANGPGQIVVNKGLGVNTLAWDGTTYYHAKEYDKVINGVHYYAYSDDCSFLSNGFLMVVDNTPGEYEEVDTYWIDFGVGDFDRNEDNDLTIGGVNYYCFGYDYLYLKTTTPGTYGVDDLFIIEDGETVQTVTESEGDVYDEFIIKEDGNGFLTVMYINGARTYTISQGEANFLEISGVRFSIKDSVDKNIDGIQYYGYSCIEDVTWGDTYITIDEPGYHANGLSYYYDSENNCMRSLNDDFSIPIGVFVGKNAYQQVLNYTSGDDQILECDTKIVSVSAVLTGEYIEEIDDNGNQTLTSIEIPDGVESIDRQAFLRCISLTSVTIPNSVTSIDEGAFYECRKLASITCKATTAPMIQSSNTFFNVKENGTLYYPDCGDYSEWMRDNEYYLGFYNWNESAFVLEIVSVKNIQVLTTPIYADTTKIDVSYTLVDVEGSEYSRTKNNIIIPENTSGETYNGTVSVTDLGYTFDAPYTQSDEIRLE